MKYMIEQWNARTQYSQKTKEIEEFCDIHIVALQQLVERYLTEGRISDSKSVALQVIMLFEGAILRSKGTESSSPIKLSQVCG
ncbi:hypothetical protein NAL32_02565 [Chryseobacterium sp. Ch-15]|uniref:Uncharacterized protein n=1 Tax=Chryseobacterium muglaense TaxID=2893752 RepID=A0A9Q3YSU7_9FLAO|nr:hypothetical protein [Chryseobacterium muglaense]MBD3903330.1 hypothetical protein [Chryseobacterium muglaense]MCC9036159.1 hypothetical protein [Chryseobacterium muglaense]MCM2553266.1 hypothetical protein [Chryseobacterium muglaense]